MTKVTYVGNGGVTRNVDAEDGMSVMQTAVSHGVAGIIGECGGFLMCSTCHVYIDEEFLGQVGPVGEDEDEMLDATAAERRPNSRLSCQVRLTPSLDGLVVYLPTSQY